MTGMTRRRGAVAALAAVTLGLGACGNQGEVTEVSDAATATAPAGDADSADSAQTEAAGQPEVAPGEEIAVADLLERLKSPGEDKLSAFEMSMDLAGGGEEMTMTGKVSIGESPEVDLAMTVPGMGELQLIVVDEAVYLGIPGLTAQGEFFQVPANALTDMGMEDITDTIDFESTWDGWDAGAQTVRYVGPEDVDGEQMDHFAVVVDTAAVTEALGETATEGMPAEVTYEVWVDEEDLMRQVSFDAGGATAAITIDNWGEEVDIQAPPPDKVTEMPSLGSN